MQSFFAWTIGKCIASRLVRSHVQKFFRFRQADKVQAVQTGLLLIHLRKSIENLRIAITIVEMASLSSFGEISGSCCVILFCLFANSIHAGP